MSFTVDIKIIDNFNIEVLIPNTLLRVEKLTGGKIGLTIDLSYRKTSNDDPFFFKSFVFTPTLTGDNFIAQAYFYLKTLPEFADAVDC